MKRKSFIFRLLASTMLLCASALYADDVYDENDCPLVVPEFDDTALLTRAERIQLMDQALKDALSKVQDCRQMLSDTKKGNSASSAGGASGAEGADSNADAQDGQNDDTNNAHRAQPAPDMTGTEKENVEKSETARPDSELSGTEPSQQAIDSTEAYNKDNLPNSQTATPSSNLSGTELPKQKLDPKIKRQKPSGVQVSNPPTKIDDRGALPNGKLPEDIPPANNDDIIARQIRDAAIAETDPKRQAKLWNEYRRYKGIPEK